MHHYTQEIIPDVLSYKYEFEYWKGKVFHVNFLNVSASMGKTELGVYRSISRNWLEKHYDGLY